MVLLWHFLKFIRTGTQNKAFDKWEGFLTTELKWPYGVHPSNSTMSGSVAIISPWILVAVKDGDGDFYDPDVWLLSWGWIDFKRSKMVISRGWSAGIFWQKQSRELEICLNQHRETTGELILERFQWKTMQLWIFKLNFVSENHQFRLRHKFFQDLFQDSELRTKQLVSRNVLRWCLMVSLELRNLRCGDPVSKRVYKIVVEQNVYLII